MALWDFSTTPASNSNADATCPFQEGQSAASVNDSIRGLMTRLRQFADDTGGNIVTAGTGDAYTLTTGGTLTTLRAGVCVAFRLNRANTTTTPTLQVDGTAAKSLVGPSGTISVGDLILGSYNLAFYNASTDKWQLLCSLTVPDGSVATAKLANNVLSADATGRGKMQDGFLSADATGRAKMADKFVTLAKQEDVASGVIMGRNTAGTGVQEAMTRAQALSNLGFTTGTVIQSKIVTYTGGTNLTATMSLANTTPTTSQGTQFITGSITPIRSDTKIRVTISGMWSASGNIWGIIAGFINSETNARISQYQTFGSGGWGQTFILSFEWAPGGTSAQTINFRAGPDRAAAGVVFEAQYSVQNLGNGTSMTVMKLEEILS